MDDLLKLHNALGKNYSRDTFPDAVLNQRKLDLFGLYKEVVARGGYAMRNGINWKGQIFPGMKNFTAKHNMTGVGNSLKKHYAAFLFAYERAHQEDVELEICGYCGGGEGVC